jgi:hypothetical protein
MPYIELLVAAFLQAVREDPGLALPEARVGLASAQSPENRGKALAAVAVALVRERSMPPQSTAEGNGRLRADLGTKRTT